MAQVAGAAIPDRMDGAVDRPAFGAGTRRKSSGVMDTGGDGGLYAFSVPDTA